FVDITGASIAAQGDASKALSLASGDAGYQQVADSYVQNLAATLSQDDLTAADNVACYCRGTLIETGRGETLVERLAIGDRVVTASGTLRPIKWIGTRSYGGRFILGRTDILPICFKAGSLGDDVPKRDLWISPHHAMYLHGVLIEARDLVNGVSIVQADRVEKVEYFHIELDSHDVILVEGALSETFVDDDSRGMFHNAHEYGALYPDTERVAARYCAKRCAEGYEVEAARRRLSLRAGLQADEPRVTALRGYVDDVGAKRIAGWAQNADHPEAPVCLDIYVSGRLVGQTLANRYRRDLKRAGLGSGPHGFEFTPPAELAFAPGAVVVRRSLDGAVLECAAHTRRREDAVTIFNRHDPADYESCRCG
ncbi:MAG TPA: Hint domain-containing protein, partial [Bradyrhizobium sp.]